MTLYDSARPRGPGFASVMPDTVAQILHPGGNPMQANMESQQVGSPMCHEMDHLELPYDTLSWPEAPTPEITIGSSATYSYQEPAVPDKQQVNTGSPYAPRQLHPDIVQLASNPMGQPRRELRAPQSAAQKAMKSGKPRGRRTKALTAAQKDHARIVRKAGRKKCDCGQRKVKVCMPNYYASVCNDTLILFSVQTCYCCRKPPLAQYSGSRNISGGPPCSKRDCDLWGARHAIIAEYILADREYPCLSVLAISESIL